MVPPAAWVRTGGEPGPGHWLRVWAARGLLYAWHGSARAAVESSLTDEAWRVREMALRVVAERGLSQTRPIVEALSRSPLVPRRTAHERPGESGEDRERSATSASVARFGSSRSGAGRDGRDEDKRRRQVPHQPTVKRGRRSRRCDVRSPTRLSTPVEQHADAPRARRVIKASGRAGWSPGGLVEVDSRVRSSAMTATGADGCCRCPWFDPRMWRSSLARWHRGSSLPGAPKSRQAKAARFNREAANL